MDKSLQLTSLKEQAAEDLDFILVATAATTQLYHWRMHRLPDSIRSTDRFGDGQMIDDWLIPTYASHRGFETILGGDTPLSFAGRDVSHALHILVHTQLMARPLQDFFASLFRDQHGDEAMPPRRAFAALLQHASEDYLYQWQQGVAEAEQFPLAGIQLPSRKLSLMVGDEEWPVFAVALHSAAQNIRQLLSEPEARHVLMQSYEDMQLHGYTLQADDPLSLRTGESIVMFSELMDGGEVLQRQLSRPIDERHPQEVARHLRLIAASIRKLYGLDADEKNRPLIVLEQHPQKLFACGRLLKESMLSPHYPDFLSASPGPYSPAYTSQALERLAERLGGYDQWEDAAADFGTVKAMTGTPIERYLQHIRPLERAMDLLTVSGFDTHAIPYLEDVRQSLSGAGIDMPAKRAAGMSF